MRQLLGDQCIACCSILSAYSVTCRTNEQTNERTNEDYAEQEHCRRDVHNGRALVLHSLHLFTSCDIAWRYNTAQQDDSCTLWLSCMWRLQDLAPVVLHSHWDQGFSQARLPSGQSPWQKSLPGAASDEASELNGFHSPSMCKEVFQFEAQETSVVQATQHVQRYLAGGTSSMRGSGSIALPPVTNPSQVQYSVPSVYPKTWENKLTLLVFCLPASHPAEH